MSLMTETATAADAAKDRLGTALEQLRKNVRKAGRAFVRAQHAAEDRAAAAASQIRRHPFTALAVAVAAGALAVGLIGFAVARGGGRRDSA